MQPAWRSGDEPARACADSVETTLKLGGGIILVSIIGGEERLYSEQFACAYGGTSLEEIAPRSFSFNNPKGACPACTGLGTKLEMDEELVVTNPDLSISEGAILPWTRFACISQWYSTMLRPSRATSISASTRPGKTSRMRRARSSCAAPDEITFSYRNRQGTRRQHSTAFEGVIPNLERRYKEASETGAQEIEQYMSARPCPVCHGARLKPETLGVTVGDRNIVADRRLLDPERPGLLRRAHRRCRVRHNSRSQRQRRDCGRNLSPRRGGEKGETKRFRPPVRTHGQQEWRSSPSPLSALRVLCGRSPIVPLTERERIIARQILKEIRARLGFLVDVGLDYLSLYRSAATLSGGEAQRIRLATQIGSSLMGVLYILDEPTIGLHQRDNARLIRTLLHLRDLGNTLLVVEHDEDTMHAADHIIDIGPGAGEHGGYVVAEGTLAADRRQLRLAHRPVSLRRAAHPHAASGGARATGCGSSFAARARTISRA